MAYLTPWRSEASENILHSVRMSRLDYLNYLHEDNREIIRCMNPPESVRMLTEEEEVERYLKELRQILEAYPRYGTPPEPSLIIDNLYMGTTANADNLATLRRHNIKYLLNFAGIPLLRPNREMKHYKNPNSPVVEYEELNLERGETYDISEHFGKAHFHIERARGKGRLLVYCPDMDRSGVICISYLITKGYSLLQAAKMVKRARNAVLFNKGFMRQLVVFARQRGLLDRSRSHLGAAKFVEREKKYERASQSHTLPLL